MAADARPPRGPQERASGDPVTKGHRLPTAVLGGGRGTSPDDDPTLELGPGAQMLGPYLLVDKIGEGGMGVVHKAVDRDGTEVAVKVLRPHIAHDDGARDRLRREVSTLARVRHDGVAPVLDADIDGPNPYLVTRYVPGPPLDDVVEERGPLSPDQLVVLGRGLAEALEEIHRAGVVHRDLKPGNVLMVGDDPVLIDFGIAHAADDVRLTMTGLVMGTPGYLSPEVVEGAPVSESTDWWGWAATLAFAASGKAPFGKGPMPVVLDRVSRGQADLSGVDERLRPLLAAALSPVPTERPDAATVLDELERYAAGGHTRGVPVQTTAPDAGSGRPSTQQTPAVPHTQVQPQAQPSSTSVLPLAAPAAQTDPFATPTREPASARTSSAPPAGPAPTEPVARPQPGTRPDPATRPEPAQPARRGWGRRPQAEPAPAQPATPAYPTAQGGQPQPWQSGGGPTGPTAPHDWAARQPDPRIGLSARTGSLAGLLLALLGITALWPAVGLGLLVLWTIAARWTDRSMTSMVLRRFQQGARRSDGVMAVVASPWHGLRAVVATFFSLLLPAFVGGVAAVTTALLVSMTTGDRPELEASLPWVVGTLMAAWVLWWGPGGPSMRRGSRSIVRGLLRSEPLTKAVMALCVVIAVWCAFWAFTNDMAVSWWPFDPQGSWSLDDWIPQLPG
ncbi:protein kinase [Barrientosiimonas humi]|uniref:serine/threonine-protein kinase n=1 Tax=Barrientosiimonas humi TaxID=999931 RepID=UPI00370D819B